MNSNVLLGEKKEQHKNQQKKINTSTDLQHARNQIIKVVKIQNFQVASLPTLLKFIKDP